MKLNLTSQVHLSTLKKWILAVLAGLALLTLSLAAPAPLTQAGPLLLTPTPTPQPEPGPAPAGPSTDLQQLALEIQKLAAIIEELKAEISALQSQIADLKSSLPSPDIESPTVKTLAELGGQPCPGDSAFTCVTLTVPLDHFDSANRETMDVVFGVLPATGERKGMFVVATGGPGSAGLTYADSYVSYYDPSIPEHFDIVFFDQRGVGASSGIDCLDALTVYFQADFETTTPEGETEAVADAKTFAQSCAAEIGRAELLPYLGTREAVEDLELFRQAIGDEKIWLYGESYGATYAQIYAQAHPDHLAELILDGPLDLTLSAYETWRQQAQAFNDVLVMTLEACNEDEDCADDMGRDAVAVYDDLATQLAEKPLPFTFPLPSGKTAERELTLADLETAASTYLYAESNRMLLQRALTAAAQNDLVPLARLAYLSQVVDPETLEPLPTAPYSWALFYGVNCLEYAYPGATPAERVENILRLGDKVDDAELRLSSDFYNDLICPFWPAQAKPERPAPLLAENIPTLVLVSTTDPATPGAWGEQVYRRLADGYLIMTKGGPHVTFGWGKTCPDDMVTAFLLEGKKPEQRETTCQGVLADLYVPLPPADANAFKNPLEALRSAETEIYYLPEYYQWDVQTPTSVGCPRGGTLKFEVGNKGDELTLASCAFSAGFAMTGTGLYSYDDGSFTLDVKAAGPAGVTGNLVYERNENGAIHVTGEYSGEKIDLSEE